MIRMKAAKDLQPGDVIRLGPCEPEFMVTTIRQRNKKFVTFRAKPTHPTGEEGADGLEEFVSSLTEEFEISA